MARSVIKSPAWEKIGEISVNAALFQSGTVDFLVNKSLRRCKIAGELTTNANSSKAWKAFGNIPSQEYIPKYSAYSQVLIETSSEYKAFAVLSKNNVNIVIGYAAMGEIDADLTARILFEWDY